MLIVELAFMIAAFIGSPFLVYAVFIREPKPKELPYSPEERSNRIAKLDLLREGQIKIATTSEHLDQITQAYEKRRREIENHK